MWEKSSRIKWRETKHDNTQLAQVEHNEILWYLNNWINRVQLGQSEHDTATLSDTENRTQEPTAKQLHQVNFNST